jgi:acetolactate synthase-1/2/3 large subunit
VTGVRNGGDLVVETLEALGAKTVFGIPGQHALGLFDAMGRGNLKFVSSRVENNSAFAADGYSRATGEVGVLFLSTGPGALTSLAGLQEAYATGVPMVVVASQIPLEGLGARRKGMLHQLDDQKASAANVTKSQRLIQHASGIPSAIQDAWTEAISSPQGPVWLEVPQNVLLDPIMVPPVEDALAEAADNPPRVELVREAVKWLSTAERPAIIAGGGTRRGRAEKSLLSIAEKLRAPVICTPGGNGAFPWNHELSLQSWIEDRHMTDLLEDADVLVVIGSSLGEVTSNYFTFEPRGRIIQIDAEPRVLESNRPGLGIRADAGQALAALDASLVVPADVRPDWHGTSPEDLVRESLRRVKDRLESQDLAKELTFMADIRDAVPADMQTFWDMTISAYWGWSCWDAREGQFHSAQGAGGLGYGFPAAIGGAVGLETVGRVRCFGPRARCLRRRFGHVLHRRTRHRQAAQRAGHLADRGRWRLRHPARVHGGRLRQGNGHRTRPAGLREAGRILRRSCHPGGTGKRGGRAQGRLHRKRSERRRRRNTAQDVRPHPPGGLTHPTISANWQQMPPKFDFEGISCQFALGV